MEVIEILFKFSTHESPLVFDNAPIGETRRLDPRKDERQFSRFELALFDAEIPNFPQQCQMTRGEEFRGGHAALLLY